MPEESYYDLLQVQPTADWEIIEVAYRRLIRRYHPDVNRDPEAEEITKQLTKLWRKINERCKPGAPKPPPFKKRPNKSAKSNKQTR